MQLPDRERALYPYGEAGTSTVDAAAAGRNDVVALASDGSARLYSPQSRASMVTPVSHSPALWTIMGWVPDPRTCSAMQ